MEKAKKGGEEKERKKERKEVLVFGSILDDSYSVLLLGITEFYGEKKYSTERLIYSMNYETVFLISTFFR